METIRTFVAVPIPSNIRRKLGEVQEELEAAEADVKWVAENNFHVTLKFLGNIEAVLAEKVSGVVHSAVEATEAFEIHLSGIGAFPRISRPSVVWVGINNGFETLKTLAEKVDNALGELDFPMEDRPFSPHITLGRTKSPRNIDRLRAKIEGSQNREIGNVNVDRVVVMKSDLRRSGPIYSELSAHHLKDAR